MTTSLLAIMTRAYEQALRTTPAPDYRGLLDLLDPRGKTMSYREYLTRPRYNWRGERIAQMDIVRANLVTLGKPPRPPRLPE